MKIKYAAYVAGSIDGKIAKNSLSGSNWTSKEDRKFFQKSLKFYDAVIIGHNTFNTYKKSLVKRNTIVLTSKASGFKTNGSVVFFNSKKENLRKFLANRKYKSVAILGGPSVYNFCLENKMLDELFVTIEPCVFTAGVPMFAGKLFKKYDFSLESVKRLNKKGTILLKYKYGN